VDRCGRHALVAPHLNLRGFVSEVDEQDRFAADGTLVDAMLKSPAHAIDLLPSGRGEIAPLTTLEVSNGPEKKTLTAYSITGFGLSPFPVWMDGDRFFGAVPDFLPAGWEKAGPALSRAQDERARQARAGAGRAGDTRRQNDGRQGAPSCARDLRAAERFPTVECSARGR
jgi:hypothetical protein